MKVSGNSGARNRKWTNQVYAVYLQLTKKLLAFSGTPAFDQ
jgi:hypothetical protein